MDISSKGKKMKETAKVLLIVLITSSVFLVFGILFWETGFGVAFTILSSIGVLVGSFCIPCYFLYPLYIAVGQLLISAGIIAGNTAKLAAKQQSDTLTSSKE